MFRRTLAAAGLLVSLLAACGSKPDTTIPVDAIKALNSDLAATYVRAKDTLDAAAQQSAALAEAPEGHSTEEFDTELMRNVLQACFTARVELLPNANPDELPRRVAPAAGPDTAPLTERPPVGRVKACKPANMLSLESYLAVTTPHIREMIVQRVLDTDAQRVNLQDVARAQLADLEKRRALAEGELARLRATAEERRAAAVASGDEPTQRKAEIDFDEFSRQAEEIDSVLAEVGEAFDGMEQFRRQLVDETSRNIARFGTAR